MSNFVKRPIEEVAEELGVELEYHQYTERPYYTGFCPFPDHHNVKTPAFAIMPARGKFVCWGCSPDGGDVIDFVRKLKGCSFAEAKKIATLAISDEDHLRLSIQRAADTKDGDIKMLQSRATKVFAHPRKLDFIDGQRLLRRFDSLMEEGRWLEADHLLRNAGY